MKISYEKAARKISGLILFVQERFATVMNKTSSRVPRNRLKIILTVTCSLFVSVNTWLIIDALNSKYNKTYFKTSRIQIIPLLLPEKEPGPVIPYADYHKLQLFRKYLDSLKTGNGKPLYDSILILRPGLIDSLKQLEELYLSQNQK